MENITKLVSVLKSPELVADFQKRCGVEFSGSETENRPKKNGITKEKNQVESEFLRHRNGYVNLNEQTESLNESCKSNGHMKNGYTVDGSGPTHKNGLISPHSTNDENHSQKPQEEDLEKSSFKINNQLYFILFHFGASLGNEIFYLIFFPFVHWNFDGTLMRQMAFVWHVAMWAGQALKDIICWPRPASPPVIKLESRYSLEYGMPSTHATVGTVIPFSLLILLHRYYEVRERTINHELLILVSNGCCS